jgi:membrane protein
MAKSKKQFGSLLKSTFSEFKQAECSNLAASLSYYTVFSLAPMLLVIIAVASLFLGQEAVTGALFHQIRGLVGDDAARAIQTMMENAYKPKSSMIATAIGIITLIFGSTGVFAQMQNCLNKIWAVKPKPKQKRQWLRQIQNRFLSFGMLLGIGFLLLVSLAASAMLAGFWNYIAARIPNFPVIILKVIELIVSISLTSALFTMMFKFLPDIKIRWRDVWKGGMVTAVLFEIGKNAIGIYLGKSNIASTYGGTGALVVILLWVYYTALILFFGASFTKAYTSLYGKGVVPEEYAEKKSDSRVFKKAA